MMYNEKEIITCAVIKESNMFMTVFNTLNYTFKKCSL